MPYLTVKRRIAMCPPCLLDSLLLIPKARELGNNAQSRHLVRSLDPCLKTPDGKPFAITR
jgi:hypothetical protein